MRLTQLLICTLLLILSPAASASDSRQGSPEDGIWTGTIGNSKVMACFMRDDDPAHTNQSAYFYLRHSKLIPLLPDPASKTSWLEGDIQTPTGAWAIQIEGDQITGNWSNPAKTKTVPIVLKRFKTLQLERTPNCSPDSDTFNPAIHSQAVLEKIERKAEKTVNGRRYRVLSALDGAVESVELIGQEKTIAALNTLLANELTKHISDYYECPTYGERYLERRKKNEKPEYDFSVTPTFWNDQWISFTTNTSGDCGGAHPFASSAYSTWDLNSGEALNLWTWIKDSKKADSTPEYDRYYFNYAAPERLNKLITEKAVKQRLALNPNEASESDNCLETITGNREYAIRLGKAGLIFTQVFPHVVYACTDDIEIPYGQLMPFLTQKGKEAVTAIQKSNASPAAQPKQAQ